MAEREPTREQMLAMNEALTLGSVRQHELTEAAESLNVQLQEEITERKRVGAALRESKERFRALFELVPVAVYSCDASGVIENFNPRAAELWGRVPALGDTDERFCGSFKLFRPDGSFMPHEQCPMAEVVASKISAAHDAEVLIERPDGSRVTVIVNIRPLKNEQGEVTGAVNCFYDITERKRSEDALRQNEEDFRTLFASAPMATFSCDRNAVIQRYNQRAADLWGREPVCGVEKYSGAVKLWFPNGTAMAHAQSPIVDVLRTGIPALDVEVVIERPDGSRVPVLANFAALRNAQGEITGAIISFMDISDRKQSEEVRRNILARFQVLADNMPALCWMANADGWIFWYNRRWYDYTGTTPETQEGWGWEAFHDPKILPAVTERWKASIATGQPFEMVFPLKGADGVFHHFLTRIVPLRDKEGRVAQWFGTSTDITNERKAEERQRLLTNELAHRSKNLMTVIQSVASRSLSGTRTLAEAREALMQRIHAIARSQSVLLDEGFEGAPIGEIVRLEFEAFSSRVKVAGPDVILNPKAAQTFALLVHELATNATKYGALSLPEGQVAIHWSVEGDGAEARFKFHWRERDGPPVIPPTRQGFGRTLLEKVVAQEFGAQPKINFAPDGIRYEIDAPLAIVVVESAGDERQFLSVGDEVCS